MTNPEYHEMYQILAEGVTFRHTIDGPTLYYPEIFYKLAFNFNNKQILVTLLE